MAFSYLKTVRRKWAGGSGGGVIGREGVANLRKQGVFLLMSYSHMLF